MKTKTTKFDPKITRTNVPWEPKPITSYYTGSEGDLVAIKLRGEEPEWCILTLRIGSPKDARWYVQVPNNTGGAVWRITVKRGIACVPYTAMQDTVWKASTRRFVKQPHLKEQAFWLEVKSTGGDKANTIRDRISTRRAQTAMRRSSGYFY